MQPWTVGVTLEIRLCAAKQQNRVVLDAQLLTLDSCEREQASILSHCYSESSYSQSILLINETH